MNKKKKLQVSIGLILAGLLSTLFLYSQVNQQQDLKVAQAILVIKENDFKLIQSITQNQTVLHKSLENISLLQQQTTETLSQLNFYLQTYIATDNKLGEELQQLVKLENEKLQLIEVYRQRAAINKLTKQYLPVAFKELVISVNNSIDITDESKDLLKQEINRLNIDINNYNAGFEYDEERLKVMLINILNSANRLQDDDAKKLVQLSQYINKVIETNNSLSNLNRQIQSIKTTELIDGIQQRYAILFEIRSKNAVIFKSLLFAASVILLFYLGLVLARLQSTHHNLKETLADLEFRKQALNNHAIVSVTDSKGKIIYVNDKFCEMSQYSRDELTGKNHRIIKSGEHSKKFYSDMLNTIAKGEIWQGQICNRAKDGSYYWVETTLIPRLNEKGKPFEFIGIRTDITSQKNSEDEIKSLARFPMENPEPVMRVNESGKIIFNNDAAEILLNHWHVTKHDKLPNDWINKIQEILNFAEAQEVELSIGMKQYLLIMTPVKDAGYVNIYGRDISERKHAEASLSYHANHDRLTGLVNRYVFEHELENALSSVRFQNKLHVLLYIDLDQFKIVNDTCGHVAGDELLCQLSKMMLNLFREEDTLARLGGDEFGVLLLNCNEETGDKIAQKLLDMINNYRFIWEGQQFTISASIGLVEINNESDSIVSILGHADVACYAAKDAGRNQIKIYNSEDSESAQRHSELQWASHIPKALAEDSFVLMVQTITPLKADKNLEPHYEILLRMVSEEGDLIPPGVFMPAAERYNLMPAIDQWVVAHVFNFLHDFVRHNGTENLPILAINLSGESMGSEELLAYIRAQFELKIVPAENICFEVTETAAIGNLNKAISFINSLKKLGCKFALDDFGSGLSSFSYLKSLPVDYLKIDGVFVKDIVEDKVDAAMVEAINQVGRIMKIKTIAEFVENAEIMDILRELGVDYAQGYHIDKPLPLNEKFPVSQQRGLKKTG